MDDDAINKWGIYIPILLTGKEKYLNIRAFTEVMRIAAYEWQDRTCLHYHEESKFNEREADHIDPWSEGGRIEAANCQMALQPQKR